MAVFCWLNSAGIFLSISGDEIAAIRYFAALHIIIKLLLPVDISDGFLQGSQFSY
jgi:hypothetical protein